MEIRANRNITTRPNANKQAIIIGAIAVGACLVGVGVIVAGSTVSVAIIGAAVAVMLASAAAVTLDIPLIGILQAAFIASFFFKNDVTLWKIDEIEDPSGFSISATLVLALFLLVYDRVYDDRSERVFPLPFTLLLIALLVCAAISVTYAGALPLGMFSFLSLITSIVIIYATASHFGRQDRISFLITGLGIGILFTGIVALAQFVVGWPLNLAAFGTGTEEEALGTQSVELSRVPAFMRTPTGMAWVVSALIPVVLAPIICRVKEFTRYQKTVLIIGAFSGIVAIILSLARGSWIGLIVGLFLVVAFGWWMLSRPERKSYLIWATGGLVLFCALLSPFAGRIYDRLTEDDDGSAAVRIPLMENAIRMIKAHPLAGVGLNGYRATMTKYDETGVFISRAFPNPVHNVFAHITTEIGIPGGIVFCLLLLVCIWECFKAMRAKNRLLFALGLGAAVSIVAFAISGIKEPGSLGSVRPPIRTCFLLLGTVMAISRVRRQILASREIS